MSDNPVCEKCGDEIMGGASIWCCRYATECAMWPTSDGTPQGDGAELLMAKLWMGNALDQIGLQIAERERLSDIALERGEALERARGCIKGLLARTPVRDVEETLAEIDAALRGPEGEGFGK